MSVSGTPRTKPRVFVLNGDGNKMGVYYAARIEGPIGYLERVEVVEKTAVDAERERMLDLLEEIVGSGVAFDDRRLRYIDVQIDREDWEQAQTLLREHGRLSEHSSTQEGE